MIKPTVGRIVWVRMPGREASPPLAAIITYVQNERTINVCAFDELGGPMPMLDMELIQSDEPKPLNRPYAEWMPYQIGQAKKYEGESK